MKSLLVIFLSLWIINAPTTDTDQDRLDQFMVKIDKYMIAKVKRSAMPNLLTKEEPRMLKLTVEHVIEDTSSGLVYAPALGKVVDKKLEMAVDMNTYIIYDLKTGKEYDLEELWDKC